MADVAMYLDYDVDLSNSVNVTKLSTSLVHTNKQAHVFRIKLFRDGTRVTVSGISSVTGLLMRDPIVSKTTLELTGSIDTSNNILKLTLPEAAYSTACEAILTITCNSGTISNTLLILRVTIVQATNGTTVAPESEVPSIETFRSYYTELQKAIAAAGSIPVFSYNSNGNVVATVG